MPYKKTDDNIYIYGLIDPRNNNIFYIGFAENLKRRLAEHLNIKGKKREKNTYKKNVINKILGLGLKPEMVVLDSCEKKYNEQQGRFEHELLEIEYIKKYREQGIKLTNLTNGGDGGCTGLRPTFQYSEDGNFLREYKSVNAVAENYNVDADIISKAIDQRGKKSYRGMYLFSSKEKADLFVFKETKKDNIPVIQLSSKGEFIGKYKSQKEASIITNIFQPNINKCLKNKRKHAGGFCWEYKNN